MKLPFSMRVQDKSLGLQMLRGFEVMTSVGLKSATMLLA